MKKPPPFKISPTEPGSALKDFATLLDFIQEGQYKVSKKLLYYPPKALLDLNQRMTKPMLHNFIRPAQKSFFHIDTLYQAAHELGFLYYMDKGNNKIVHLNIDALSSWNKLNHTEQYFTLLEACMVNRVSYTTVAGSITYADKEYLCKGKIKVNSTVNKNLIRMKLFLGLACLELFGLCDIESGKPDPKSGWKIKSLQKTPAGEFVLSYFDQLEATSESVQIEAMMKMLGIDAHSVERKSFYYVYSPFFPDYKNTFQVAPKDLIKECDFIFKVSWGKVWRRIALNSKSTLDDLAGGILHYFDFMNDHLHQFTFLDMTGKQYTYPHHAALETYDTCSSDQITLEKLGMATGMSMIFLFDFGDEWIFNVLLESTHKPSKVDKDYVECYLSKGEAPEQYPDYDDEDD